MGKKKIHNFMLKIFVYQDQVLYSLIDFFQWLLIWVPLIDVFVNW